jgi:hypothetical protein
MKRTIIIALLLSLTVSTGAVFAQLGNIKVSGGLVTSRILGDNPATKPIVERDTSKPFVIGGSFDVPQNGLFLNFDVSLDEDDDLIIPFGIEYYMFRSAERVPITSYLTFLYKNSIDMQTIYTGFKWKFFKFPVANAKAYIEAKIAANFIGSGDFTVTQRRDNMSDTTLVFPNKDAATRLGGSIKIGFEGEVLDPIYVDTGVSLGVINFLGRDETLPDDGGRGELLTPLTNFESKESIVQAFNIFLSIKYRL